MNGRRLTITRRPDDHGYPDRPPGSCRDRSMADAEPIDQAGRAPPPLVPPPAHGRIAALPPLPLTLFVGREREVAAAPRVAAPAGRAPADPDRPGRGRQDPPGARRSRRRLAGLRRRCVLRRPRRRSAIPPWSPPTIAQALGVARGGRSAARPTAGDAPAGSASCCSCWTTSSRSLPAGAAGRRRCSPPAPG